MIAMKNFAYSLGLMLLVVSQVFAAGRSGVRPVPKPPEPAGPYSEAHPEARPDTNFGNLNQFNRQTEGSQLNWQVSLRRGVRAAEARGELMVVYFTAEWCPYCVRMDNETLRSPEVLALKSRFIWARADTDRDTYAEETFSALGLRGLPAISLVRVVRGRLEEVDRLTGFVSGDRLAGWLSRHR